ncbi:MAG: STAS domain-containing protein [Leptospirales bacterium]|nr:STAS domain-containing protein [Leptospirales bacterium]
MEVSVKTNGRHTIAALNGQLDLYSVGELKRKMQEYLGSASVLSLAVDLTQLKYMDSSGIALMAHLRKKMLEKSGGEFFMVGAGPEILNVLRLAALDQFFTFVDSEAKLPS